MSEKQQAVELGDYGRDQLTGFEGHVVATTTWLHGCRRFGLEPAKLDKDGKLCPIEWFDEPRVKAVERGTVVVDQAEAAAAPGGPRPDPAR